MREAAVKFTTEDTKAHRVFCFNTRLWYPDTIGNIRLGFIIIISSVSFFAIRSIYPSDYFSKDIFCLQQKHDKPIKKLSFPLQKDYLCTRDVYL